MRPLVLNGKYLLVLASIIAACVSISAQSVGGVLLTKRLHAGEPCPVSTGSHPTGIGDSSVFCAKCLWFGSGPAYFAWAFRLDSKEDKAVFDLTGVSHDGSGYLAKTPWVAKSDYSGPITISGKQVDGKGTLRFAAGGSKPQKIFLLTAPNHDPGDHWSFWPALMIVSRRGCYTVRIETSNGTDFVVFTAK